MKSCPLCGKKSLVGGKRKKLRGKYNPTGKYVRKPNLQWARTMSGSRIHICTHCLKAGKNLTAPATSHK